MATRKYKKRSYKKNTRRARRRTNKRGGGCGCNSKKYGGSLNLENVNPKFFYTYNGNLTNDPQNPSSQVAERFAGDFSRVSGGARRRNKKRIGKTKKGGMSFLTNAYSGVMNSGSNMNAITSFGVANGANVQANTITGLGGTVSNSAVSQPVLDQPYGYYNPPLA